MNPRRHAPDLHRRALHRPRCWSSCLLFLTGGGDSPFFNLFFPLVAVNAYYFGRWVGLLLALVAGLLYWAAACAGPAVGRLDRGR